MKEYQYIVWKKNLKQHTVLKALIQYISNRTVRSAAALEQGMVKALVLPHTLLSSL